jgi:4'-phosphopantetheinyl transferase EntD
VQFHAIGIDAALNRRLERAVCDGIVATRQEREWAGRDDPRVHWEAVLFSVKEAVFKAWWPWQRQWLEFEDVRVSLDPAAGSFRADLPTDHAGQLRSVKGRFAVGEELILSTVVIPAP